MIRLVATDLDGTLLREDRTISPRTAAALRRLCDGGRRLALVTGRPLRWMPEIFGQLDTETIAVCANGAVVYDPAAGEVLRTDPLSPGLLAELCRRIRAEIPGAGFAVEVADGRELRFERVYAPWQASWDQPARALDSERELCAVPAVKLLVRGCEPGAVDSDEMVSRVTGCLAGLAEATHSSASGLVEISAAGITKASGLAWLCRRLNVAADEVLAFGDMPNDVPMLLWAGRAVAVRNAHAAVRDIVDDVTSSNDEDGVARYLERLLDAGEE